MTESVESWHSRTLRSWSSFIRQLAFSMKTQSEPVHCHWDVTNDDDGLTVVSLIAQISVGGVDEAERDVARAGLAGLGHALVESLDQTAKVKSAGDECRGRRRAYKQSSLKTSAPMPVTSWTPEVPSFPPTPSASAY